MTSVAKSLEQSRPLEWADARRSLRRRENPRRFPDSSPKVHGKPLVYLDNAATSQKPRAVIDAVSRYYEERKRQYSSRRALPLRARDGRVRGRAQNGAGVSECRATRAKSFSSAAPRRQSILSRRHMVACNVGAGDEVVITAMEHHSNIVPWQMLCEEKGAQAARRADQRSRRTDAR